MIKAMGALLFIPGMAMVSYGLGDSNDIGAILAGLVATSVSFLTIYHLIENEAKTI